MKFKKCENCKYFVRPIDAPEEVEKDCVYYDDPDFDEDGDMIIELPCERC